jgi:hypothetical protein
LATTSREQIGNQQQHDLLLLVIVDAYQQARWGETITLYGVLVNLTYRDIILMGNGCGVAHVQDGRYLPANGNWPDVVPRLSVTEPFLLRSIELDPTHFDLQETVIAGQMSANFTDTGGNVRSTPAAAFSVQILP